MKALGYFLTGIGGTLTVLGVAKVIRKKRQMWGMEFGDFEAWAWFNDEFPCFVERHGRLQELHDKVFAQTIKRDGPEDYVILGLGQVCVDDYQQILLLCGNGYGIGALQLVRGMFERQVTAAYLSKYPKEVDDFVNYTFVHKRKLFNQFKTTYRDRPDIIKKFVSDSQMEKIEADFKSVKKRFMKVGCEKCGAEELMYSWNKLDPTAMALKGEMGQEGLAFSQYFRPTLLNHSTFLSVDIRIKETPDGFVYDSKAIQRKYIAKALLGAHNLLLNVLELQNSHFKLGLDEELEACQEDYLECWGVNQHRH